MMMTVVCVAWLVWVPVPVPTPVPVLGPALPIVQAVVLVATAVIWIQMTVCNVMERERKRKKT